MSDEAKGVLLFCMMVVMVGSCGVGVGALASRGPTVKPAAEEKKLKVPDLKESDLEIIFDSTFETICYRDNVNHALSCIQPTLRREPEGDL